MQVLDWAQPWYAPFRSAGVRVAASLREGMPLADALSVDGAPVRFVPQDALPAGTPYEQHIFDTGTCPVRENLHDFFNGLAWLHLPRAKRAMNRLQAQEIARHGIGGRRGAVRDAITVFDENGAVLHAPPPLWEALLARDWRRLFVDLRPLWGGARLVIVGHALLEGLAAPRKELTAHIWCADAPAGASAELDGWLAAQMDADRLAGKPFTPLPVLGVPGWWPGNGDESFYDDAHVFRPRRPKATPTTPPASPRP